MAFPEILNILLIFPPEPITSILSYSLVSLLIQCSNSCQVSFLTISFNKLTVPILKDLEATFSPL